MVDDVPSVLCTITLKWGCTKYPAGRISGLFCNWYPENEVIAHYWITKFVSRLRKVEIKKKIIGRFLFHKKNQLILTWYPVSGKNIDRISGQTAIKSQLYFKSWYLVWCYPAPKCKLTSIHSALFSLQVVFKFNLFGSVP